MAHAEAVNQGDQNMKTEVFEDIGLILYHKKSTQLDAKSTNTKPNQQGLFSPREKDHSNKPTQSSSTSSVTSVNSTPSVSSGSPATSVSSAASGGSAGTRGRWRHRLQKSGSLNSPRGEQSKSDLGAGRTVNEKKDDSTKFGAVRVHASVLSQSVPSKSYVINSATTGSELLSTVLMGYSAVYQRQGLFFLKLEKRLKNTKEFTELMKIQPTDKVLEVQSGFQRGEARFCLCLYPEASSLTIHDKCIHPQKSLHTVFIDQNVTCRQVLQLIIKANKCLKNVNDFLIHTVDSETKTSRVLEPSDCPLECLEQTLDHNTYLEIKLREELERDSKLFRRSRSLEEVPSQRRLLNIREVRKNFLQHNLRRKTRDPGDDVRGVHKPANDVTPRETTLSKLRDNLNLTGRRLNRKNATEDSDTLTSPLSTCRGQKSEGSRAQMANRRTNSADRTNRLWYQEHGNVGEGDPASVNGEVRTDSVHSDSTNEDRTEGGKESGLSAWERRKLYDVQRRTQGSSEGGSPAAMEEHAEGRVVLRKKRSTESNSAKARFRRSLPIVPPRNTQTNSWLERSKAIAESTLDKVKLIRNKKHIGGELHGADCDESDPKANEEALNIRSIEDSALRSEKSTPCHEELAMISPRQCQFQPLHPHPVTAKGGQVSVRNTYSIKVPVTRTISHNSDSDVCKTETYPTISSSDDVLVTVPPLFSTISPSGMDNIRLDLTKGTQVMCTSSSTLPQGTPDNQGITKITSYNKCHSSSPPTTLHKLLKTHSLHSVSLVLTAGASSFSSGFRLSQVNLASMIANNCPNQKFPDKVSKGTMFSPRDNVVQTSTEKRAIIGRSGSAFMRVSHPGVVQLIDGIDTSILSSHDGLILAGDIIIEVNGTDVFNQSVVDVPALLDEREDNLCLVVARTNNTTPACDATTLRATQKELEKYKLMYESAQLEAERYMNMLADVRVELHARDSSIQARDNTIQARDSTISQLRSSLARCQDNVIVHSNNSTSNYELYLRNGDTAERPYADRKDSYQFSHASGISLGVNGHYNNAPQTSNSREMLDYELEGTHVSAV